MTRLWPFGAPALPRVGIEIAPDHVAAVSIEPRGDGTVRGHGIEPLPAGALTPSLAGPNVQDRGAIEGAVRRALARVGDPGEVALLIPDPAARITVVHLEQVPARRRELESLIRWQVRRAAPFGPDEAQVSWSPAQAGGGHDFVVTLARRDVIQEYEGLCTAAGAHAGLVDVTTGNLLNALVASRAAPSGDWLLVHVAAGYVSLALMREASMLFFRSRARERGDSVADSRAGESVEAVADAVHQTMMYYQDRLSGPGVARIVVAGPAEADEDGRQAVLRASRDMEGRLSVPVHVVSAADVPALAQMAGPAADAFVPLVGLLLRGRQAA